MNKVLKNRIAAGASLVALMLGSASCADDIGLKVTAEAPNAGKTIYEIIKNDPDLSNFIEVLDSCDLPGGVSVADSLFNKSRVYTLWAPTNMALNDRMKDSIISRIKDDDCREDVMRTFVYSHLANNLHPAKGEYGEEGELVLMLNNKKVIFEGSYRPKEGYPYDNGYKFGGNYLKSVNDRAWNGIVHKVDEAGKYRYNIWEAIQPATTPALFGGEMGIDSVAKFLYSFNVSEYVMGIPGPIENGVQTYLDSTLVYRNQLLNSHNGVGLIDSEDSIYTVYLPTNRLWNEFQETYGKHFKYDLKADVKPENLEPEDMDSLMYMYPRINMVKYLTFSDRENKRYVDPDSMMTANTDRYKRLRVARSDMQACEVAEYEGILSNGSIKVIDKFPYTVFELWHDTIWIEAESETMRTVLNKDNEFPITVNKDKVRRDHPDFGVETFEYYELHSNGGTEPQVIYKLPNVKAASYKIGIVTVPKNLIEDVELPLDETFLNITVKQAGNTNFYEIYGVPLNHERIDTLFLPIPDDEGWYSGDEPATITFPDCEYYNTNDPKHFNAILNISSYCNEPLYDNYDPSLRIDKIILVPVEDPE